MLNWRCSQYILRPTIKVSASLPDVAGNWNKISLQTVPLSLKHEHTLAQKEQINPRTAKDFVKMLEEAGIIISKAQVLH